MKTEPTPLTAGIADGFATLRTRLVRLNRTPKRPRRGSQVAFAAALCLALGASVPLRLVARAQSGALIAPASGLVAGKVIDQSGRPVAGASIYAMQWRDEQKTPIATVVSDAKGNFRFPPIDDAYFSIDVFADAGARGIAEHDTFLKSPRKSSLTLQVAPGTRARVRLLDPQGKPATGLKLRLWRLGADTNHRIMVPSTVWKRMQATTDAQGIASFPPLPANLLAQFVLDDQRQIRSQFGTGDVRGGKYAPLSSEDFVSLSTPGTLKTIRLLSPIKIEGQVSLPNGGAAGNVLILARRINAAEAAGKDLERDQLIAQTRSNAAGKYVLDGLRPGRYYVWTYPEKRLTRDYVGQTFEKSLLAKTNRVDFSLSRGALIQGVVVSQETKRPVKGQTMGLFDAQENYQYAITDARGFFQFRVLGGKQQLWIHTNGTNSPPPGFTLPTPSKFNFFLKNGEKREFQFEMPVASLAKPVMASVAARALEQKVSEKNGLLQPADSTKQQASLKQQIRALRQGAELIPLSGPGIVLHLKDNLRPRQSGTPFVRGLVHDYDILQAVNELWAAHAEGIAVNTVRLSSNTSIRCIGSKIYVGRQALNPPYKIEAVGNPETMRRALSLKGGLVDQLSLELTTRLSRVPQLRLPAATETPSFRFGKAG